jgi:Protein of unknown function, DUF255
MRCPFVTLPSCLVSFKPQGRFAVVKLPFANGYGSWDPASGAAMTIISENRLKNSASPYLRSAAHEPVDSHEWGEEAFQKVRAARTRNCIIVKSNVASCLLISA